jgi:hypothetical protein
VVDLEIIEMTGNYWSEPRATASHVACEDSDRRPADAISCPPSPLVRHEDFDGRTGMPQLGLGRPERDREARPGRTNDALDRKAIALRTALGGRSGSLFASRSVGVSTKDDRDGLAVRSCLDARLAQVTSRLLDQLAKCGNGAERGGHDPVGFALRNTRGDLVPRDTSPFVAWRPVVVESPGGSLLALVAVPSA